MASEEHLKAIELFSELSKSELKKVSRLMTEIRVRAGKELMKEGRAGREFKVILDGEATPRYCAID